MSLAPGACAASYPSPPNPQLEAGLLLVGAILRQQEGSVGRVLCHDDIVTRPKRRITASTSRKRTLRLRANLLRPLSTPGRRCPASVHDESDAPRPRGPAKVVWCVDVRRTVVPRPSWGASTAQTLASRSRAAPSQSGSDA
jgi:hypothetical protein